MNARKTVLKALLKAENGGYSTLVLNGLLKSGDEHSPYITACFYGVLERKITLDFILDKFLKKGINAVSDTVKNVLRIGLYEALYMDNVPLRAAVNEAVELIKQTPEKNAASLINAVLRKASIYDKQNIANKPDTIRFSAEDWIIKAVFDEVGEDKGRRFFENSLLPPPVYVKVNTNKITADKLAKLTKFEKTAVDGVLKADRFAAAGKYYDEGFYHIQDISAALCVMMAKPDKNDRILDVCAAPGGKSFTAAELAGGEAEIVSCDIWEQRVSLIKSGAERLGLKISAMVNDAGIYNENLGSFSLVLCDVPCSGIGIIRRKPEIKYKKAAEADAIIEIQKKILKTSAEYVADGGRLLYSTCTLNRRENEDIVAEFLQNSGKFVLLDEKAFLPEDNGGDGFYAALLSKR